MHPLPRLRHVQATYYFNFVPFACLFEGERREEHWTIYLSGPTPPEQGASVLPSRLALTLTKQQIAQLATVLRDLLQEP